MKPYYERDGITIYHGDCREVLPTLPKVDLVLTDPPYGIGYEVNWNRIGGGDRPRSIANDENTEVRDAVLDLLRGVPAAVFASWKTTPPPGDPASRLVWEKTGSSGMGDLSFPWRPNTEDVWVYGAGWVQVGGRMSAVLRVDALCGEQRHPNEKPVPLLEIVLCRAPPGLVLDPFMGSGTTLVAAKNLHRQAIGIEIEERYCEIAAKRLDQGVLPLGGE